MVLVIDQAIRDLDIYPVILDVYRQDGLVPVEAEGDLHYFVRNMH